ncbi:MAG: pyridoxamine 5'-phosphate oxidase family protein [Patescibacteria group bacterium]
MDISPEEQNKIRYSALEFLKSHNTMVVSTVSEAGEPQAAAVYYVVDNDFNFYFMSVVGSRKCTNLSANGKMAFVVGTGPEINTVQGGGMAEAFDEQAGEIFGKLSERIKLESPEQWPLLLLAKKGFCTFRVKPTWMVWLNLHKGQHPDVSDIQFHKII